VRRKSGFSLYFDFDKSFKQSGWELVAHSCNPTYSEGRDQEDRGSKSAWANSSQNPILKTPITKIGLVEWLKV
jgi:hypothetical protein